MLAIGLGPTGEYPCASADLCLSGDGFDGQGQGGAVINKNVL